jgi:hypothetical protein
MMENSMQKRMKVVLTGFLMLGAAFEAAAQPAPILRQNEVEIGAFAGFNYGADNSHAMGGGNVTYSATRWLLPYVEAAYLPGIQRTSIGYTNGSSNPATKDVFENAFTALDFGFHARVRIPHTRIVPYIVAGIGLLHTPPSTDERYENQNSSPPPNWYGPSAVPLPADTSFAENFGGGIRYYVGEQFGFRAETKGYHYNHPASQLALGSWIYQATFGVFYQFGL